MNQLQDLNDVFSKKIFRIPDYQRGFAWGKKQLIEFWEDIISLDENRKHYTGVISIKKISSKKTDLWQEENWLLKQRRYTAYHIVDGQQRLTTVSILLKCIVEYAKNKLPQKDDNQYLGSYPLSEIESDFICIENPQHKLFKTYKFGYEADNPSFRYLKHVVFGEPDGGSVSTSYYTVNLRNANQFFKENIEAICDLKGVSYLEEIFEKTTRNLLFNVYEIDDDFDVFVAFETMNNRGKRLSNLELLKNRLIYLTTLYSDSEVDLDNKSVVRDNINSAWKEVYTQIGRNEENPLNDDEFLRAHWILYFKYSRKKGNDYIKFLLEEEFSPKNIHEKINTVVTHLQEPTILNDGLIEEEEEEEFEEVVAKVSRLQISELNKYVNSLKTTAPYWYATWYPKDNELLVPEEMDRIDRLNRIGMGYFRTLVVASFLNSSINTADRLKLFDGIERFVFLSFRLSRAMSNYKSSVYYNYSKELYFGTVTITEILQSLENDLAYVFDDNGVFIYSRFYDHINQKFRNENGKGFYTWNGLRYFLFEYERKLLAARNQVKIKWDLFVKSEKDKVSIEHIYPQSDVEEYWVERFNHFDSEEKKFLSGTLGNLLPLSAAINSSLQNYGFDNKKTVKYDKEGSVIRNGFENGSHSERKVALLEEWNAQNIYERGLELLKFMEERWEISLGTKEDKTRLLHLQFINQEKEEV